MVMYSQSISEENLNSAIYNYNDNTSVVLPDARKTAKQYREILNGS